MYACMDRLMDGCENYNNDCMDGDGRQMDRQRPFAYSPICLSLDPSAASRVQEHIPRSSRSTLGPEPKRATSEHVM